MFGLPNFNLDEMAKMVADFQVRHERMVSAIEALERKLDLIVSHLGVDIQRVSDLHKEVTEAIEHDDSN